jgi:hypothetical protein
MEARSGWRRRGGLTYAEACQYAGPECRGPRVSLRGKSYQVRAAFLEGLPRSRAVLFNLEGEDGQTLCGIHHSLVSFAPAPA